jgi:hypothetical protein
MYTLIPTVAIAIFSFGTAIFYALSRVEWSVLRLGLNRHSQAVKDEDVRFVHRALKRLTPLLPPSNGAVILLGTAALVYLAVVNSWSWLSILPLAFFWLVTGYLITFGRIAAAVKDLRNTSSEGAIKDVRRSVGRLVVRHHIGLVANLGTALLTFLFVPG